MNSSYMSRDIDYVDVIKLLINLKKPQKIVEFGILDGYSLNVFAKTASSNTVINAYDIFEEFTGNNARRNVIDKFNSFPNVTIAYGDFYKKYTEIEDNSIDLLHIDIANNGDVYKFAIEKYMPKLRPDGLIIFEGGSDERDKVDWMIKYNKPKIAPILNKIRETYDTNTMGIIPSMTVIWNTNIRELEPEDFHMGFMQLINHFTRDEKTISFEQFVTYTQLMKTQGSTIYVIVENNRIIGTGKIFMEYKFHNNLTKMGHIEDVVVNPEFRQKGIGKKITERLINHAKNAGAYKVVLNCNENVIAFYEKCGMTKKDSEMCLYLQ